MIPVNEPLLNGNEKRYLAECIDTGWISSDGPFVARFEAEFAARVGRKYAVAVTNGTAALDVAVSALGIGAGDEVIMPTFTIISCVHQIVRSGAKPVLVDCDPITWNMNVGEIETRITPRTKAVMAVHIYGLPVDLDPLCELAKRYNLRVIEDAAEMHGQDYRGKPCGSFGTVGTFSFYPNKHITTGEGGMVVTDDVRIFEHCRYMRNLCFQESPRFVHEHLGWNLRMSNLQAAVGVAQLERLAEFVARKRKMGMRYSELLHELPGVQLPLERTAYAENVYWVYGLVLDESHQISAAEIIYRLKEEGIGARPFFYPMHLQPLFRKMGWFRNEKYPVAENLSKKGFYIPSGLALTDEQMEETAEVLWRILG